MSIDSLHQDMRFALRALRRNPGFALVTVLTLALGIGANSAIFSVVSGVLLRPLPFQEPDRIVRVYHLWEGSREVMSPANVLDVRAQSSTLESLAFYREGNITLTGEGEPERLQVARVSDGFFDVLRPNPLLGRTFRPDENEAGNHRVAILGHALWRQRFGGDPAIAGRMIEVNGERFEVAGVMPDRFDFPAGTQLWIPEEYTPALAGGAGRGAWYVSGIGRLRPGATLPQAEADVAAIGRRLEAAYPEANARVGMTVISLRDALVGDLQRPLLILLGAVGLVLLIACANVASLLLARASSREGELAIRAAIGAGRGRIVRQLLTESLLLGLVGGGAGLLLAAWGTRLLLAIAPADLPGIGQVAIDLPVVAFTLGLGIATGLLFGLAPVLQLTRSTFAPTLRSDGRGSVGGRGTRRARGGLVVAEVALAMMLLVGAGLLLRSYIHLQDTDPGFRTAGALTFRVSLPAASYDSDEARSAFFDSLLERLRGLPGVSAAAGVQHLPMTGGGFSLTFSVGGRPAARPGEELSASVRTTTPGYFTALGVPLVSGRSIETTDRDGAPTAFVISESAARKFFPEGDPIGKTIRLDWGPDSVAPVGTVVGVVGDVRDVGLAHDADPTIYLPYAQRPIPSLDIVLRTGASPLSLGPAVRAAVAELDPMLPVYDVRPLDRLVSGSIAESRFYTLLLSVFGTVALVLATIGIFGVISYSVVQRTREIGLRMALGATPRSVLRMVVGSAALLSVSGVALGLTGALAASRVLGGLLYGVGANDPATFAAVAALLLAVALLASFVPASAATRVDPNVALRGDR